MRNLALLCFVFFMSAELALATKDGTYRRLRPVVDEAHAGHEHTRVFEGSLNPDLLAAQLVDDIHEISHDHEERKQLTQFASSWLKQFNLVRTGRDLVRWGALRTHKILR